MKQKTFQLNPDREEIEARVRDRQTSVASQLIAAWIDRHHNTDALIQACDWYRRLGLYKQGLKILDLQQLRAETESPEKTKKLLWVARFLNLSGAGTFALRIVSSLKVSDAEDCRVIGNIFLTQFEISSAQSQLSRYLRLTDSGKSLSYMARLSQISLADCYSAQGRFDPAADLARAVGDQSDEPLLKGIALQAQGEYLARKGDFTAAYPLLKLSTEFFPAKEKTADRAVLDKWLGYVLGKRGDRIGAAFHLGRSFRIFRELRARPEAWLDVLRLKVELGLVRPEFMKWIYWYPGIAPGFKARISDPGEYWIRPRARIFLDFASDEARIDGQHTLKLNLELKLLGWIAATRSLGLSLLSAKELLWPDEFYSFLHLDARLEQLLWRIRHYYGVNLLLTEGVLRVVGDEVGFRFADATPPLFLHQRPTFSATEAQKFYGLSKTQSHVYLAEWKQSAWIRSSGSARSSNYVSLVAQ